MSASESQLLQFSDAPVPVGGSAAADAASNQRVMAIVGGALGSLLLLVAGVLACLCIRARAATAKKRAALGSAAPAGVASFSLANPLRQPAPGGGPFAAPAGRAGRLFDSASAVSPLAPRWSETPPALLRPAARLSTPGAGSPALRGGVEVRGGYRPAGASPSGGAVGVGAGAALATMHARPAAPLHSPSWLGRGGINERESPYPR